MVCVTRLFLEATDGCINLAVLLHFCQTLACSELKSTNWLLKEKAMEEAFAAIRDEAILHPPG